MEDKSLCSASMAELENNKARLKKQLKPNHVIHTLMCEHEVILGYLCKLEELNAAIQKMKSYDSKRDEFKMLVHIAEHLIEAEAHHEREEEVLFPELERRGVYGPPSVMRAEHIDLRQHKKALLKLATQASKLDFNTFKKDLAAETDFITTVLEEHIGKEDGILYPMALEVIKDEGVWYEMKADCDKIGYCCFTPKG
jgi:hypothetical protein|tara:strand:+ start:760 stop:1350 length:591 start_codon:yes stop_codon:yes gene_type:complete